MIFVVGGRQGTHNVRTVEAYDTQSNTWTVMNNINVQRSSHQVVALNGKLYVIGGHDGDKKMSSVEVFQPEDSDYDGLPDFLEKETGCPNVNDGDSDNDGLPDGTEEADHDGELDSDETDPCDPDTDGDGIQDGTELGYTTEVVGIYTDSLAFQPDLDPATTTDPLKKDTDGDGLSDGEEDANYNGRLDDGETDPARRNTIAMPWIQLLLE